MKKKKVVIIFNSNEGEEETLNQILSDEYEVIQFGLFQNEITNFEKLAADLIILNIIGKSTDSTQLLKKLINWDCLKNIPIILLTEDDCNNTEAMALQLGAMDYLKKPTEKQVLLRRIERAIQIQKSKNTLIKTANKDMMTDLWNRNYIESYLKKLGHDENQKGIFLLLDMDNFKSVNDTFGHVIGDKVLIKFAQALKNEATNKDIICRIGGDEFVLFIAEDLDVSQVRVRADRILDSVEEALQDVLHDEINVSVSIGIAGFPKDGKDFGTLYANADKALYFVKQNGKRGFHFYREGQSYSIQFHQGENAIDIEKLKEYIKESQKMSGAYTVRYDGFKRIFQFVSRCIERTRQNVQILIFTVNADNWNSISNEEVNQAIEELGDDLRELLRKGDVASKYSNSQYIVILMDTNKENGEKVAERVVDSWEKRKRCNILNLTYSIDSIERK